MNCNIDKSLLHQHIDGELAPIEKMILQEHLSLCSNCQKELNQLKILDWDFKNQEEIEVPLELKKLRQLLVSQQCEIKDKSSRIKIKDIYQLQYNTLKHSLNFINYLPGKSLVGSKSIFSKIIGL